MYKIFCVGLFILSVSYPEQKLRETISLSGDWLFAIDSLNIGMQENWQEKGLPNNKTRKVKVPHTWNVEPGFEMYAGKAWYQKQIEISNSQIGKLFRIQFDAVYHDAAIFINGKLAAEHIGSGYTRFFVDATPYLHAGKNSLLVCADNSYSSNNIPYLNSFDWPNDGGIIRNVFLVVTEKSAIQNVKITSSMDEDGGMINLNIKLLNASLLNPSKVKFKARIVEENQTTSNQVFEDEIYTSFSGDIFSAKISLQNIKKWHFDSPNLYRLFITEIVENVEVDEFSTVFGFRSIKVVNNRITLNGEPLRLMGLEWMPGSTLLTGMSESYIDMQNNLKLMKDVNCVFSRFHWQQDEYIFDWCDRNGILVQEEIPYWGGATLLNDTLLNLGYKHLNEMIDAHFNHPSIIAWGIGNELQSHDTMNIEILKKLYKYAKQLDDSRLVNYVSNQLGWHKFENANLLNDASYIGDVMFFNEYYSTWFNETLDRVPFHLKKICEEYPDKPLVISEWGLCEPFHKGGDSRRIKEMLNQIKMYSDEPNITGAIYFCLNDYRTHVGEDKTYSYPQRVHGVVNIHLEPKASYDTLKIISSPIIVSEIIKTDNKIELRLAGNTGIPSYTVENYFIEAGGSKILIDKLLPGQSNVYQVPKDSKELIIRRPTGFEVLRVSLE
ncbi:MAG: hypothetical protein HXY50_14315 [Ignavibacteriaceae bacterium]|nr:hypothetical protein [Ignavibacteriaceae bacterium]